MKKTIIKSVIISIILSAIVTGLNYYNAVSIQNIFPAITKQENYERTQIGIGITAKYQDSSEVFNKVETEVKINYLTLGAFFIVVTSLLTVAGISRNKSEQKKLDKEKEKQEALLEKEEPEIIQVMSKEQEESIDKKSDTETIKDIIEEQKEEN